MGSFLLVSFCSLSLTLLKVFSMAPKDPFENTKYKMSLWKNNDLRNIYFLILCLPIFIRVKVRKNATFYVY